MWARDSILVEKEQQSPFEPSNLEQEKSKASMANKQFIISLFKQRAKLLVGDQKKNYSNKSVNNS